MKRLVIAATLLAAGCTYEAGESVNTTQLHTPFTYRPWQVERAEGMCVVSSGHNGISVEVRGKQMAVKSNRKLTPGDMFVINAGGERFETHDNYFPPQVTPRLVDALSRGGKAYLEWSEIHLNGGMGRVRPQNIVKLDSFPAKLKECTSHHKR